MALAETIPEEPTPGDQQRLRDPQGDPTRDSKNFAPVIDLNGLSVRFGRRPILQDLQGELRGRAIGLLGPNGAGKTTLIHTLLGFHAPSSGTAHIFGRDITTDAKHIRSLVGYMPERDSYIAKMSAVHFVRLMAELSGLPSEAALERAHEALFYVGLGEARYRSLDTYSLGMKQLAKLAQAIVHGPRLIFLDEPTNGLDPPARQRMIRLVREIRDSGKANIVLSSHLLRDVEECCEEILILKDGRLAVYCNLEEERKSNRKFLLLETRGDQDKFVAAIGALGCEYAVTGDTRVKVVLQGGTEVRDLYRIAAQYDVQIRRMSYKRDSLEDIFLKAMETAMAVYEQTYKQYLGKLTPEWSRFLVIPRHAFRDVFKSKLFTAFFVVCFIPLLIEAILIYLHHNVNALAILKVNVRELIPIDASFFQTFVNLQGGFAFFVTLLVGPPLVARDLRNNALPLYLCRPFSRTEYVLGKMSVLLILLSAITWVPQLLLFLFQSYLEGARWLLDNLWLASAIFIGSFVWILLLALLSQAVSALVKWRVIASAALLGIFFIPSVFGEVVNGIFLTRWGNIVSLNALMRNVTAGLFGTFVKTTGHFANFDGPGARQIMMNEPPLWASWSALFVVCAICLALLSRKVKAYEIVR